MELRDAFHSTKISGNSGSKSNGTEIFRKLVSKISVHLSRLSSFLEIWKFRKFPVPFGISTRYESAPVPFVVKLNYKMAASLSSWHYTRCKMICHSSSLCLIETKTLGSDFLENCGLVVPNFLWVSSPLSREKTKFHSTNGNFGNSNQNCLVEWNALLDSLVEKARFFLFLYSLAAFSRFSWNNTAWNSYSENKQW